MFHQKFKWHYQVKYILIMNIIKEKNLEFQSSSKDESTIKSKIIS